MSCPKFSDAQLATFKKLINETVKTKREIGLKISGGKNLKLGPPCRGDNCSVNIRNSRSSLATWHSHPTGSFFMPSPDDVFIAYNNGNTFHCVGGKGVYEEVTYDKPTTVCFASKTKQMNNIPPVTKAYEAYGKAVQASIKRNRGKLAGPSLMRAMQEDSVKEFNRLGRIISEKVYTLRCEYVHE